MNDTQNARRPSRLSLLLGLTLVLAFIVLSGCAAQPNSNLSASSCCTQQAAPYNCRIQTDADGHPVLDSDKNILLTGDCHICVSLQKATGIPLDSAGKILKTSDCGNNCNFAHADCSNADNKNSCYLLDDAGAPVLDKTTKLPVTAAPVCASLAPDPCVQNNCTAMLCGKPRVSVRLGLDNNGINAAAGTGSNDNAFSAEAKANSQTGLVGRICEFRPLDAGTNRLLKSADWFVNSMRLGIGGTFSDYDRARFYLPSTDFFCSSSNPNAVVDRFTNYLSNNAPLPAFGGSNCPGPGCNYHADLTYCKLDSTTKPASPFYYCTKDPASPPLQYPLGPSSSSAQAAYLGCNQACNANRLHACSSNPDLLLTDATVSPPTSTFSPPAEQVARQPFVDTAAYLHTLENVYPTPGVGSNINCAPGDPTCDATDYYKKYEVPPSGLDCNGRDQSSPGCQSYLANQRKPGPAGAKVFECISGADCLSGTCDQSTYSRSQCFLSDGTAVACGCHAVSDCEQYFQCSQYSTNSVARAVCDDSVYECQRQLPKDTPGTAIVCDYDTSHFTPSANANSVFGTCNVPGTNQHRDGTWGVLDFAEYNKFLNTYPGYSNIEMATLQAHPSTLANPNLGGGGKSNKPPPPPPWVDNPQACTSGDLRWYAGYSFRAASNEPTVAGLHGPAFVTSSPLVTWQNDNCALSLSGYKTDGTACDPTKNSADIVKFPLIRACKLLLKQLPAGSSSGGNEPTSTPKQVAPAGTTFDIALVDPNANDPGAEFFSDSSGKFRVNKTWAISGFGDCQTDSLNRPIVQSYGICKPCGTLLTMAYQNVSRWPGVAPPQTLWMTTSTSLYSLSNAQSGTVIKDQSDSTFTLTIDSILSTSPSPISQPSTSGDYVIFKDSNGDTYKAVAQVFPGLPIYKFGDAPSGYCPGGCTSTLYSLGQSIPTRPGPAARDTACVQCSSAYPSASFSPYSQGSPATSPEYGFLVNKIDEYQSAGVMPILDLRNYPLAPSAPRTVGGMSRDACLGAGGSLGDSDCVQPHNGVCNTPTWQCNFPALNDWLLGFLSKNHSATLLVASDLPSDCPADGSAPPAGSACQTAKSKVAAISVACPECLVALQYSKPIPALKDGAADAAFGSSDLATSLWNYFPTQRKRYDPASFTPPWNTPDSTAPPEVKNVSVLVLPIDLSSTDIPAGCTDPASPVCAPLDAQINFTLNISRHVLQSVGWPTVWKLTYDGTQPPSSYSQSVLYAALYRRSRELSLAGVVGVLLPPLDERQTNGNNVLQPPPSTDGLLINPPPDQTCDPSNPSCDRFGIRSSPPFCAAQAASSQFLHPQVLSGLQRLDAKAVCGCVPCSSTDISTGHCDQQAATCADGSVCQTLDSSGHPNGAAAAIGQVKCEPQCLRAQFCPLCSSQSASTTCTAVTSSNLPPVKCDAAHPMPFCDLVQNKPLKSLTPDDPLTPSFLSGLPSGSQCCIQQGADLYTYRSVSSITLSSEPAIFPGYGSNTSDCGRVPNIDANQQPAVCSGIAPAPLPISNKLWVCTTPS